MSRIGLFDQRSVPRSRHHRRATRRQGIRAGGQSACPLCPPAYVIICPSTHAKGLQGSCRHCSLRYQGALRMTLQIQCAVNTAHCQYLKQPDNASTQTDSTLGPATYTRRTRMDVVSATATKVASCDSATRHGQPTPAVPRTTSKRRPEHQTSTSDPCDMRLGACLPATAQRHLGTKGCLRRRGWRRSWGCMPAAAPTARPAAQTNYMRETDSGLITVQPETQCAEGSCRQKHCCDAAAGQYRSVAQPKQYESSGCLQAFTRARRRSCQGEYTWKDVRM